MTLCITTPVALAHRGLIGGDRIADFKSHVGYKNLAFDLLGLASLLRDNWEKIATRTGVQVSELDQAEVIGQQLMDAVGSREQTPATVAQVQAQRQRNFTLFVRSYDQVRRAIAFLRWDHGDIDQICPSLYAGRGGSRRKETPAPTPPDAPPPAGGTTPSGVAAGRGNTPPAAEEPFAVHGVGAQNDPFATGRTS